MSILLTTGISYSNSFPHIGHMYESILADFLKKQLLLLGNDVKLLTGTDEHGKKIQDSAKSKNMDPKQFCDEISQYFKTMNDKLKISYNHFIRTTDEHHKNIVQKCIIQSTKNNDIYLGEYKGYYCIREETFITEDAAKLTDYKDPITNTPYEYLCEESYFFKLSNYINEIQKTITSIVPIKYQTEVKDRLISLKELNDLSISRTSFDWGIQFPNDDKHIIFVWVDALFNYFSGSKIIFGNKKPDKIIHLIGKDIIWFHSIIYPALLKSCLNDFFPTNILVHGFICDKNGKKMSKSVGNVISPDDLEQYPLEAIRFYMLSESNLGEDLDFSIDNMVNKYNNILIDSFGNIVQRLGNLCIEYIDDINKLEYDEKYDISHIIQSINNYDLLKYFNLVFNLVKEINIYLTNEKPWDKNIEFSKKIIILKTCLHKLNFITKLLYPYIPDKINEIRHIFGFNEFFNLNDNNVDNLIFTFKKKQIIFNKLLINK